MFGLSTMVTFLLIVILSLLESCSNAVAGIVIFRTSFLIVIIYILIFRNIPKIISYDFNTGKGGKEYKNMYSVN